MKTIISVLFITALTAFGAPFRLAFGPAFGRNGLVRFTAAFAVCAAARVPVDSFGALPLRPFDTTAAMRPVSVSMIGPPESPGDPSTRTVIEPSAF